MTQNCSSSILHVYVRGFDVVFITPRLGRVQVWRAVFVSPSPDDVFTRLGHGAGTKSTQRERGAKSGLVWNMEHGQCEHQGGRGEELHQQIFAALTIGQRTMVGSGPGQVA